MNDSNSSSSTHFLDHPEVKGLFESIFSTLVLESDRGAVLIGASHIDLHLRSLFETAAPQEMSKRELRRVLDYPGPLSSLAAKADVAYLTRLISKSLHEAIHHLRRIRNDVAHSPDSFSLAEYGQRVRRMYELGPGVPMAINRWAVELIIHSAIANVMEVKDPTSDEEKPIFSSPQEAFDYLAQKHEILTTLDERRPRYEFAWGVGLICALIVHHRETAKDVLDGNVIISLLKRRKDIVD